MITASTYPLSMTTSTAFHELSTYEVKTTTTSQFETNDDLKGRIRKKLWLKILQFSIHFDILNSRIIFFL